MAKQVLSNEFVSDSDSEETSYNEFRVPHFEVPKDYKKLKHLKNVPLFSNNNNNNSTDKDHELWLFKVPKDLDISKIKSLPLDKESQFQVDGRNFKIELDDLETRNNSNMAILSTDKDDILKILNKKHQIVNFNKIFTINYTTNIPNIQYDKIKVPRQNVPRIEGLKVRHFATGYYEEEEEEKQQNEPKEKTQQKKRKHDNDDDDDAVEDIELKDEKKKSKKNKKDKKDKKDKKKKKEKKH